MQLNRLYLLARYEVNYAIGDYRTTVINHGKEIFITEIITRIIIVITLNFTAIYTEPRAILCGEINL